MPIDGIEDLHKRNVSLLSYLCDALEGTDSSMHIYFKNVNALNVTCVFGKIFVGDAPPLDFLMRIVNTTAAVKFSSGKTKKDFSKAIKVLFLFLKNKKAIF